MVVVLPPSKRTPDVAAYSPKVAQDLEDFATAASITAPSDSLVSLVSDVARSGAITYWWPHMAVLIECRILSVLSAFHTTRLPKDGARRPHSKTPTTTVKDIRVLWGSFRKSPPWTIQRLCEILASPERYYSSFFKLSAAIVRMLLVTSDLKLPEPTADAIDEVTRKSSLVPIWEGRETGSGKADFGDVEICARKKIGAAKRKRVIKIPWLGDPEDTIQRFEDGESLGDCYVYKIGEEMDDHDVAGVVPVEPSVPPKGGVLSDGNLENGNLEETLFSGLEGVTNR